MSPVTMSPVTMSPVTIYHNPRCSKSRQTLALLRERNVEPEIIEYLKTPPSENELEKISHKLGIPPAEMVRKKEARALKLSNTEDSAQWIARMAHNPQIIERPIVVCGERARIGRPPENILELLS